LTHKNDKMNSYNQRNVKLAENITTVCVIIGALASWFTHNYIFMNIIALPVGLIAIAFSHDLTMKGKARYSSLNYKFARRAYIIMGLVFIVFGVIGLVRR
jgi:hypothetical protein